MVNERRLFSVVTTAGAMPLGLIMLPDTKEAINASDNIIARVCGFDGIDEYQKCYPGGYKAGSAMWNETIGDETYETHNGFVKLKDLDKDEQNRIGTYEYLIGHYPINTKDPHKIPAAIGWEDATHNSMFAFAPTIKEARSLPCWQFAKHDDFWWCRDWTEGGDE